MKVYGGKVIIENGEKWLFWGVNYGYFGELIMNNNYNTVREKVKHIIVLQFIITLSPQLTLSVYSRNFETLLLKHRFL